MIRSLAMGIACAIASAAFWPDDAVAQSCRAIEREIRALQSSGGGGGGTARYEKAFREQAAVLAQTQRQARQAGCMGGGFMFFRAQPHPICRTLIPKLSKMQANLGKLDRLRRRGGGEGRNQRRIRALQAMARDACEAPRPEREARREFDQETVFEAEPMQRGGTFRTLCVRSCDGYYFPVSFATTRDQFATDSQACQSMCPGATAELYFHPNPGSGPEEMISLGGASYSQLPTAFKYRTSYDSACTCNSPTGRSFALIQTPLPTGTDADPTAEPKAPAPAAALPEARPQPGEDPETVANLKGSFAPRFIGASPGVLTSQAGGQRPVRVVGPAYWGAQAKEGVVLTPVPN